ncbi:hypothetical protein ScPMuIL_011130 [Solemya velum]
MAAPMLTCRLLLMLLAFLADLCTFPRCELFSGEYNTTIEAVSQPTVVITILVRNKAHVLPWFLGHLEKLDYPKHRIGLWIRNDHSIDDSAVILQEWVDAVRNQYHFIDLEINNTETGFSDEKGACDWSVERFDHVIKLRQEALNFARRKWADYLFMLDADIVLENKDTLTLLMAEKKIIVGPMLNASIGETYSNFWAGMDNKGYYQRKPEYFPVVNRETLGSFPVPMVHSAVLMDLRYKITEKLAYDPPPKNYRGPIDDIIIFAHSIKSEGLVMHILNTEYFGQVLIPMGTHNTLTDDVEQFHYVQLEAMDNYPGLSVSPHVNFRPRPKDTLGFDQVYMINLVRRQERRDRMMKSFDILGIDAKVLDAVDGKLLNETYLKKLGVQMMPGYADPYHVRPLTMGEIGCFLSHYKIWEDMLDNNYERIIVFEDDVRFEPYFRRKFFNMMREVDTKVPDWDLLYIGRKRLHRSEEWVDGSEQLVWPSYSYWTLSYLLSRRGATKLVQQRPLQKMIPVDEYLPIMFDRHPEDDWKKNFYPRNLVGVSAEPLLVNPTHYTGEVNYISDTEDSHTVDTDIEGHDEL